MDCVANFKEEWKEILWHTSLEIDNPSTEGGLRRKMYVMLSNAQCAREGVRLNLIFHQRWGEKCNPQSHARQGSRRRIVALGIIALPPPSCWPAALGPDSCLQGPLAVVDGNQKVVRALSVVGATNISKFWQQFANKIRILQNFYRISGILAIIIIY